MERGGMNSDWTKPFVLGLAVIAVAFVGAGTWAATARLDGAVMASGRVEVLGDRKVVQHRDGGVVAEILVGENASVEAGDALFRIDPLRTEVDVEILRDQRHALVAEKARLTTEISGATSIVFPDGLPEEFRLEQERLFDGVASSRANEISVLERQVEQYGHQIAAARNRIDVTDRHLALLDEEWGRVVPLVERDLLVEDRRQDLERRRVEIDAERASAEYEMARLEALVAETELRILQVSRSAVEEASMRLGEISSSLREVEERIRVAEDVHRRSIVVAPISGRVVGQVVHTVGQVVAPGDVLLEIVPEDAVLVASARLSPLDVTHVGPGLIAELRFPSFKQATTPVAFGEVGWVSADAVVDEATRETYYELRVDFDGEGLPPEISERLVAGMPAEVVVSTGERTVLEYLLQPLSDAIRVGMREE